ncbi:hypothetical protein DM02DRAFT_619982 [Periconia macrospinosa]|uniref:Uncharacterized protein n=1 Tax=Periconia macrospinosa TaxID=97972 RepID=A0A2V1D4F7_9PLEO|nr:hypothetical protein DM02DRAFT_619982 [Periconia macrospinosa]
MKTTTTMMWKSLPQHEPENLGAGDEYARAQEIGSDDIRNGQQPASHAGAQHDVKEISTTSVVPRQPDSAQGLLRRIGKRASLLFIPCLVLTAASIGFLAWLWYGERTDPRWRRLMLGSWSNQAVTISALVFRTSLSVLGAIATSMIASVAFERSRSSLRGTEDVVSLAVARFSSPAPYTFVVETLFHRYFVALPLRALLFALILTTITLQFGSTILLYDLGMGQVTDFPVTTASLMTGYGWVNGWYGNNTTPTENRNFSWVDKFRAHHTPFLSEAEYWPSLSRNYDLFAETSQPPAVPLEDTQIIDDTGPTLRSFLPIKEESIRRNLVHYSGFASVFDARVVCVRPDLVKGSLTQSAINLTLALPSVSHVIPNLITTSQEFQVQLPLLDIIPPVQGWLIAPLSTSVGGMLSSLDAASRQDIKLSYEEYSNEAHRPDRFGGRVKPAGVWRTSNETQACGVDLGTAYLVMHPDPNLKYADAAVKESPDGTKGPWRGLGSDLPNPQLGQIIICFDALPRSAQYHHIQDFEITASGVGNKFEPPTTFRTMDDVALLRQQLMATDNDAGLLDRNILHLDSVHPLNNDTETSKQWKDYCAVASELDSLNSNSPRPISQGNPNIYNRSTYPWLTQMALYAPKPIALCGGFCLTNDSDTARSAVIQSASTLSVLFSSVVEGAKPANSAALPLQAVLTQILRDVYHTWNIRFDYQSNVTTVLSETRLIPLGHLGLWAVIGVTLLHLFLCLMALIAFATLTKTSHLNNAEKILADL